MKNLLALTQAELKLMMKEGGFGALSGKAVYDAVWYKHARSFEAMDFLSPEENLYLQSKVFIPQTSIKACQQASDGTLKALIAFADGNTAETVLIPTERRVTICVSSQIGCSLSCKFCATGYMERKRNLRADEIVDQAVLMNALALRHYGKPIGNVVFMGMGEPLLNYKSVCAAIEKMADPRGLALALRRITVSTAGIAKMIHTLSEENVRWKLALSLHAANDEKRNKIMPINETNSLKGLREALHAYHAHTGNGVTFEYILLKDFNDSLEDAAELVAFAKSVPHHMINIIEFNPIDQSDFQKPDEAVADAFLRYVYEQGLNVHLRRSRGKDIDAACGQLALKQA